MTTYLPKEVQDGLKAAHLTALGRRNRLRVGNGDTQLPVLRLWSRGLAVPRTAAPRLRGLVDVHDGGRHLWQCLIVAAAEEGDEVHYEFKRQTVAQDRPAVDFEIDANAPVALLPRA